MAKNRALAIGTTLAVAIVAAALLVVGGGIAEGKPPADSPGSQARTATYFARFGDNGTEAELIAGNGVVSVSREVNQFGEEVGWVVRFAQPVDQCAWTASVNPFFGGPPPGWGPILVGLTWDNTVVPPENQTPDPYVLRVLTTDANGQIVPDFGTMPPNVPVLETYSVNVSC